MKNFIFRFLAVIFLLGTVFFLVYFKMTGKGPQPRPIDLRRVKVKGRHLLTDFDRDMNYTPYFIKGVIYQPMPVGRHPGDTGWIEGAHQAYNIFDNEDILKRDFPFLKAMRCNTLRLWKADSTYDPKTGLFPNRMTRKFLDWAERNGIKVIPGFWIQTPPPTCNNFEKIYHARDFTDEVVRQPLRRRFTEFVSEFKDHPAVLFWAIGNGNDAQLDKRNPEQVRAFYSLIDEMSRAAHEAEGSLHYHPVAYVTDDGIDIGKEEFGTLDEDLPDLDIWGVNAYRGMSFGDLFKDFASRSGKPLWISEFGVDAFHAYDERIPEIGVEDQLTQTDWISGLWDEIISNRNVVIGGSINEFSDEWWRPDADLLGGSRVATHDHFGRGAQDRDCDGTFDWFPGAPDRFFHDEWFGIMAVSPNGKEADVVRPREVYYRLQNLFEK